MKKHYFLTIMFALLAVTASFSQTVWTGNSSRFWDEAGNWSLGVVPNVSGFPNIPCNMNSTEPDNYI